VEVNSINPHDNTTNAKLKLATTEQYELCIKSMEEEKERWMLTPAPVRGEIVRQIGLKFREYKDELGSLISLEMGKIKAEGDGEVQEVIDICDFACGLSRSLEGKVLPSERPGHFMMENWNPLGIVGVITAFNFPCAVLGWNACIGLVCGDLMLWKGAPSTPLVSVAVTKIFADVLKENGFNSVLSLCQGDGVEIGELMCNDPRIPLISFTGSTKVGRIVNQTVSKRFGKCILELGGNNAVIIMEDGNVDMALKACAFSAVGTAGQR
jgi:aldehyde dehydrogenase family 7 member A1